MLISARAANALVATCYSASTAHFAKASRVLACPNMRYRAPLWLFGICLLLEKILDMTSLKLGIVGLESAEISRVRILLRLLAGSPNFHWSYAAVGPFDAVLIAQSIATPADAVRIDVLPAGAAAVGGSLLLPIDANALEEVLYILQGVLSRNRRKFRQPINVACPAPGRWGRPNSRVTSRHFDHGNASRTSRPDCSGLDEAD
ncbi:hypothetical protein N5C96_13095 [Delftia tsuruhatensis]|uniref:hypothetical protein n=1 Tax=Delftia tsuruhatensis TaxID=180282 RepID=UPI002443B6FA|nr:hypothetical protein [Delftia tsuruhatensis]MDH0774334.1 hypothetical protein [Delftia tsuruhatensis]MDH1461974.1 hypothetical protein [Delftia tsuruhatensis]MDH2234403.1 hypothetical protein [Delftia tsuruhatensis]WGG12700.1 hypothetical protein N5O86_08680 [Delftia tsuruhatensis]